MGTLYIVATPIGNLDDISIRAIRTLFSADIIACEDTRRAGMLMSELRKRHEDLANTASEPQFFRYDDHTEQTAAPELLQTIRDGKSIALISDAGTPLISDPGYLLVREARSHSIPVVSIPGASALLTALTSSGLPADKFLYVGYPPEKQGHRLKLFSGLPKETTTIFYCAPHKLLTTLEDMHAAFGDIEITVCRELTKVHEEVWSGTIALAQNHFSDPKGEFVLLIRIP